jgi:hypothetical protein
MSSINYDLLQGSTTILAGILIFLTIRHFRLFVLRGQKGPVDARYHLDAEGILLMLVLTFACISVCFSVFIQTINYTPIMIVITLIVLFIFVFKILYATSSKPWQINQNESLGFRLWLPSSFL